MRTTTRLATLGLAVLLMTGCAFDEAFHGPPAATPAPAVMDPTPDTPLTHQDVIALNEALNDEDGLTDDELTEFGVVVEEKLDEFEGELDGLLGKVDGVLDEVDTVTETVTAVLTGDGLKDTIDQIGGRVYLGNDCWYLPDFLVVRADLVIEVHETKGRWMDDARVKIRAAADRFPFVFRGVKKGKGGAWEFETFSARGVKIPSWHDVIAEADS